MRWTLSGPFCDYPLWEKMSFKCQFYSQCLFKYSMLLNYMERILMRSERTTDRVTFWYSRKYFLSQTKLPLHWQHYLCPAPGKAQWCRLSPTVSDVSPRLRPRRLGGSMNIAMWNRWFLSCCFIKNTDEIFICIHPHHCILLWCQFIFVFIRNSERRKLWTVDKYGAQTVISIDFLILQFVKN